MPLVTLTYLFYLSLKMLCGPYGTTVNKGLGPRMAQLGDGRASRRETQWKVLSYWGHEAFLT